MRQRAGLALSTLHAPRVLFLDEPTAGVDVESRGLFWELIQDASDEGVTVFVTTHFLEEADYCDRVAFIDAGRLVADSTPEGLRARYSSGYRIEATLAAGSRERVLAELGRAGFAAEAQGDRLRGAHRRRSMPTGCDGSRACSAPRRRRACASSRRR